MLHAVSLFTSDVTTIFSILQTITDYHYKVMLAHLHSDQQYAALYKTTCYAFMSFFNYNFDQK